MVANIAPIFTKLPRAEWVGNITAANTAKDGTGTVNTVFTAGAEGSYVQKLKVRPQGTNVPSVLRVFLNNGLTNVTAANNVLVEEQSLPSVTISEISAVAGFEINLNIPIPPGYKINVTLGTAVAAGYAVAAFGGDY